MTPSAFMDRCTRRVNLLAELVHGLDGRPFRWGSGEYSSKKPMLLELGVTLQTKTGLARDGHRVKRGGKPIGYVYFPAPIQKQAPVYLLDVQTAPVR